MDGKDAPVPVDKKTDLSGQTFSAVHRSMLWQIGLDYGMPPDVKSMTVDEIVFWYDGLRPTLRERTKRRS